MMELRERIEMGEGNFYRLVRWSGDDPCVEVIEGHGVTRRIPAHGAHWHYHRAIEITLVFRGGSSCFSADQLHEFRAGELFILGENIPHYWHHPRGSAGISIQWELPENHGAWECNELKPLRLLAERARRGVCISGASAEHAMVNLQRMTRTGGLERLGLFLQLMHGLMHADADTRFASAAPLRLEGTNPHEEAVQRALSYIHANYREPIGLPDLLSVTGMGRTTFIRHFFEQAGCCFSAYLNRVRLRAVCRQLNENTKPIGVVALDEGFTQLAFFNRLFRREFGMTPTAFRARGRELKASA